VNVLHHRVGRHRDVDAPLDCSAVSRIRPIPQASKAENLLVRQLNEIRSLLALGVQVPFVEACGDLDTTLAALPRSAIRGRGLDRLNARVYRGIL
jgi:hypothetical protein